MLQSASIEARGTTNDAVDLVTLAQQQFSSKCPERRRARQPLGSERVGDLYRKMICVQIATILASNAGEEGDFALPILVNVSMISGNGMEDWDLVLLIGHYWVVLKKKSGSKLKNRRLGGGEEGRQEGGGRERAAEGGLRIGARPRNASLDRFSFLRVDSKPSPKSVR